VLKGKTGVLLGALLLLVGAAGLVVSLYLEDRPAGSLSGDDSPVSAGARDRGEINANNSPTLARNPSRPDNLAVANRIDTPRFSCALNVSFDGGGRWSQTRVAIPEGEEPKCFAPDVAFDSDGTLYMSFVTLRGTGNVPHAAWIVRSRDGGRTLSKPQKALGPLAFQVRLTPDPARPGRLYLSWLQASDVALFRFTQTGNPIRFARSDDGGATWQRSVRVSSAARARVVAPSTAVGKDGEIYVLFLDLGEDRLDYEGGHEGLGGPPYQGRFELVLARSRDGGASWEESVVQSGLAPIERFLVFLPAFPSLAVDRDSGRIYAGFHDQRAGAADVLVWSRPREGSGWEGPTRVNDNPARDGTSQYLPKLAVAPSGRLDVVYYDRRSDRKNVMNEVSLQSSYDDGKSFTKRIRLSEGRFDSRIGFGSERELPDLGSRLGLVSDTSEAHAVWTDTRAGTVVSNKQVIYGAEVTFPARLSKPLKYVLRYGGGVLALVGIALVASAARRPRQRTAH
jgi:hypothetical protein